jgi:pimeloyl-ACP methyl ester carboxylesterase
VAVVKAAILAAVLVGCTTASQQSAPRRPQPHYADLHGLHMYYEDAGAGPPLVLLHGGGSTVETTFGKIMPKLARSHRVIAPEEQGHGHTPDLDRPLTFEQMADDTAALLGQLGIHDADILGFSNGGMVALQLAIRHPGLVHRLIICSAFYGRDGVIPAMAEAWRQAPDPSKMPPALRDAYLAAAPHPDLARFVGKTIAMLQTFIDVPESTLHAIAVPTLVMVGDHDVIRVEHALRLSQVVAHGELAVFPDSGHGTYLGAVEGDKPGNRQPDVTAIMIETFLAR